MVGSEAPLPVAQQDVVVLPVLTGTAREAVDLRVVGAKPRLSLRRPLRPTVVEGGAQRLGVARGSIAVAALPARGARACIMMIASRRSKTTTARERWRFVVVKAAIAL